MLKGCVTIDELGDQKFKNILFLKGKTDLYLVTLIIGTSLFSYSIKIIMIKNVHYAQYEVFYYYEIYDSRARATSIIMLYILMCISVQICS